MLGLKDRLLYALFSPTVDQTHRGAHGDVKLAHVLPHEIDMWPLCIQKELTW